MSSINKILLSILLWRLRGFLSIAFSISIDRSKHVSVSILYLLHVIHRAPWTVLITDDVSRGFPVFGHFNRFFIDVGTFTAADVYWTFFTIIIIVIVFYFFASGTTTYTAAAREHFSTLFHILFFSVAVVMYTHTLAHSNYKWYYAIWRYIILLYYYTEQLTHA